MSSLFSLFLFDASAYYSARPAWHGRDDSGLSSGDESGPDTIPRRTSGLRPLALLARRASNRSQDTSSASDKESDKESKKKERPSKANDQRRPSFTIPPPPAVPATIEEADEDKRSGTPTPKASRQRSNTIQTVSLEETRRSILQYLPDLGTPTSSTPAAELESHPSRPLLPRRTHHESNSCEGTTSQRCAEDWTSEDGAGAADGRERRAVQRGSKGPLAGSRRVGERSCEHPGHPLVIQLSLSVRYRLFFVLLCCQPAGPPPPFLFSRTLFLRPPFTYTPYPLRSTPFPPPIPYLSLPVLLIGINMRVSDLEFCGAASSARGCSVDPFELRRSLQVRATTLRVFFPSHWHLR